jgi:hypothetical protein
MQIFFKKMLPVTNKIKKKRRKGEEEKRRFYLSPPLLFSFSPLLLPG